MTVPIYPAAQKNKKVSQPPQANEGPPPHIFRDPRHGRALEPGARVPLDAERRLEAARVLRGARVRVRQVPHRVLGRLLVAPLGDDDVRLAVVRARGGRDAREPLELVRVRRAPAVTSYRSSYSATRASISPSATSSTAAASSFTPQVLTCTPKRSSASVLSPSVTATYRMLSPKRASLSVRAACQPAAARCQSSICWSTVGFETCPTTVLRATPSRLWM